MILHCLYGGEKGKRWRCDRSQGWGGFVQKCRTKRSPCCVLRLQLVDWDSVCPSFYGGGRGCCGRRICPWWAETHRGRPLGTEAGSWGRAGPVTFCLNGKEAQGTARDRSRRTRKVSERRKKKRKKKKKRQKKKNKEKITSEWITEEKRFFATPGGICVPQTGDGIDVYRDKKLEKGSVLLQKSRGLLRWVGCRGYK